MKQSLTHSTTTLLLALATCVPCASQAAGLGQLDPTFGEMHSGKVTRDFEAGAATRDEAEAIALRPDGSFYLVGNASISSANAASGIGIARFSRNGVYDNNFGTRTFEVNTFGDDAVPDYNGLRVRDAVLQADGGLLVAVDLDSADAGFLDAAVCRFRSDGAIDVTFGGPQAALPGCAIAVGANARALLVHSSGRIVLAGSAASDDVDAYVPTLLGFDSQGGVDAAFAGGRVALKLFNTPLPGSEFAAIGEKSTGQIVVGGTADAGAAGSDFIVAQFTPDGALDTTFGPLINGQKYGFTTVAFDLAPQGRDVLTAMAVSTQDPLDAVVVAGQAQFQPNASRPALAVVTASGATSSPVTLDPCVAYDFDCDADIAGLALTSNNSIELAGNLRYVGDPTRQFIFAYGIGQAGPTPFGTGDPAPGFSRITFDLSTPTVDGASAVALQDGRLLVAGFATASNPPGNRDFAVARLGDGIAMFEDGFESP